jgi:hypothetical protein
MPKKKASKKSTPTKKKSVKKSPSKSKPNGKGRKNKKEGDPAAMRMTGILYYQFKSAFAEMMETRARHHLLSAQVQQEKAKEKYKTLVLMMRNEEATHKVAVEKQKEFAAIQQVIAKKFNIPETEIANWSFDTDSGMLYPPGEVPKETHSLN